MFFETPRCCVTDPPVKSLFDLGENFDEEEGHDKKLKALVAALPDKPRAAKLKKARLTKTVDDLLLKLKVFRQIDRSVDEDGQLSREEVESAAASAVSAKDGRSLAEAFAAVDQDGDGKIVFLEFYLNTEVHLSPHAYAIPGRLLALGS